MTTTYDVIIIGSGPAGYTAGIYSFRAGLKTLILEGISYGGQLMNTTDVENFPGFSKINGFDLMMNMKSQCQEVLNSSSCMKEEDVIDVVFNFSDSNLHKVITSDDTYLAKTVIIATGATANKLSIPNGDKFWNKGISACAVCDGALSCFRNKPLIVVGGGDTACEEALFLSRFGSIVYMLIRGEKMRASFMMRKKVEENEKIKILYSTQLLDVNGDKLVTSAQLQTGHEIYNIDAFGIFYAIGHTPNTKFLHGALDLDENGYIITSNTKTKISGVFACGDVQDKIYRQAITAAGTGCMAALEAEKYLS
jgi:thioredoxin reductase (NADPH)